MSTVPPRVGAEESTWTAGPRLWEAYFVACLVVTAGLTYLVPTGEPVRQRWLAVGLLGAMAVWYLALGRRVVWSSPRPRWQGQVFQSGLLVLFAASMIAVGTTSLLLFALCPLAYLTLRFRQAHAAVAVYAFTPALLAMVLHGPGQLRTTVPMGAIALIVSLVIAITTERTERVSEERAALIRELESTRAEVARLSRQAGIAEERQRLAGDIHDTLAQGLSSVVMLVEAADGVLARGPEAAHEHLRLAARTARENLAETRAIVAALTPSPLAGASLADALGRLVERFGAETGTAATITTIGTARPLSTGIEVVLLRVAQEALANVRKHAGATRVGVRVRFGPDEVAVQVCDDGGGFDITALSSGYGLGGMQARMEQVGGRLAIASTPGAGTTVQAAVPA